MASEDKVARTRLLERALTSTRRGVSVRSWAAENAFSWRTVYRDLRALERAGVPIYQPEPGRFALDTSVHTQVNAALTAEELLAVYSLKELSSPWRHTRIGRAIARVWSKVGADLRQGRLLPRGPSDELLSIRSFVAIDYGRFHKYVETLETAVAGRRTVVCKYRRLDGQVSQRTIEPGQLHFDPALEALYVVAWCRLRKALRVFAVHRFLAARMTDDVFPVRPETRPASALKHAFRVWRENEVVTVRARFRGQAAVEVSERRWHASQKLTQLGDGAVEIELEVAGLVEVERWLLGYGANATAISPPELVGRVGRQAAEAARQYVVRTESPRMPARVANTRTRNL